jgi:ferrous iron transport protein A
MSFVSLAFSSDGVRPLAALPAGARGVVATVIDEPGGAGRLLSLGVTPGASITVLQTHPGIVFLCDQTELVVERAIARTILVRSAEVEL